MQLHLGQQSEALELTLSSLRLERLLANEAMFISHLVRIAIAAVALPITWECLQIEGWSDDQLEQLQEAWAEPQWLASTAIVMRMERAMFLDVALQAHDNPQRFDQMMGLSKGDPWDQNMFYETLEYLPFGQHIAPIIGTIPTRIWQFAWLDQDTAFYCETMQTIIDGSLKAAEQHSFATFEADLNQIETHFDNHTLYGQIQHRVSLASLPVLFKCPLRLFTAESFNQIAITAIALARYKRRHGSHPKQLADLTPDFLESIPFDPMDGQPLRYRLKEDGSFLLYSVGEDGVDDGGDPSRTGNGRPIFNWGNDWVWPQPASRSEIDAYYEEIRN